MRRIDDLKTKVQRFRAGLKQFDQPSKLGIGQTRLSEIECASLRPGHDLLGRVLEIIRGEQHVKSK